METVLDVYQAQYDEKHVLICMDEASRQLLDDLNTPLAPRPARDGQPGAWKRVDDKYVRHGVRSLFMF